jgi:hypothetical protein
VQLEAAVTEEMTTYMAEWEDRLANLEDQISLLQVLYILFLLLVK